jgi:putative salt-induced outer membrane protein
MNYVFLVLTIFLALNVQADERLKNESELGVAIVSGNSNTENYTLKQLSTYKLDDVNSLTAKGRYLQGKTSGIETARSWDASLRFERALSELWSLFVQQQAESDVFSGFIQRDSSDLGAKYFLTKTELTQWFAELGYRYVTTQYLVLPPNVDKAYSAARLYTEVSHAFTTSTSAKLWLEYVPSFKDKDAYFANGEASVTSVLSSVFSFKTSYLAKYQNPNIANLGIRAYTDTTFLTSLIAKF